MPLFVTRAAFVALWWLALWKVYGLHRDLFGPVVWAIAVFLPPVVVAIDVATKNKRLEVVACVALGLFLGSATAWAVCLSIDSLLPRFNRDHIGLLVYLFFGYLAVSLLLQLRARIRLPFIEPDEQEQAPAGRAYLLDTSTIIDGRIVDVVGTRIFDARLVVPQFVVAELQAIADSSEKQRRARGRRGLDVLHRLRNDRSVTLEIDDRELPEFAGKPVDQKLVLLARHARAKLLTNDYNLNRVAELQGVEVVNLNDLAVALKPTCLPGERLTLEVVRPGEQPGQGVGYLEDGTMVVVEGGRDLLQQQATVTVTSVTQNAAGRMIFGRAEREK